MQSLYQRTTLIALLAILLYPLMSILIRTRRTPSLRNTLHKPTNTTSISTTPPITTFNQTRKMHIQSLPMWTGSGNNYAYLVSCPSTLDSVIIDPANPPEVLPTLNSLTSSKKINLKSILNTHHHHDHAGGNTEVLKTYPLPVIGGKDCAAVSKTPGHGESFSVGSDIKVTALHTPCHTQDSICYFFEDTKTNERAVFTGDTLFIGGCGRFFEGTPKEMHKALNEVLAGLPDDTKVYPGHEYTRGNVKFGVTVSQSEALKRLEKFANENRETQGCFTVRDEKGHNVFMRLGDEDVMRATGSREPVDVMGRLREMKNSM